ncbi:hypothetical protein DFH07DRAFT_139390 [Mycena maculata]|uniref:Alcohol dehydrogenase-like N-terminal domain-containing protein n=1 Tax=Mycena maculata TaxID=230809 RepID=A0AAD7NSZ5_9AGAR|nr:hypothetical protein DFH07DRAFT_139390 [Mycena maculata]
MTPTMKDNKILVNIAATGVCRSDVELLTGVTLDTRKYTMGHEGCGVPVRLRLGSKVDSHAAQIGKLYSILAIDGSVRGINGLPALENTLTEPFVSNATQGMNAKFNKAEPCGKDSFSLLSAVCYIQRNAEVGLSLAAAGSFGFLAASLIFE